MLTLLGFVMIAVFLTLIMMKRMSPMAALILIPALFCIVAGQAGKLGKYVLQGIGDLAPTAAMLMFAIIYFGIMIDVGLFDPVVRLILRFCKADPMRIVIGTAVLAAVVSLDGDGSTTFMITVSAMLPLYRRLKMNILVMTAVAATANGIMNTVPWGGPTARAATALKLDPGEIFVPMVPTLLVGLAFVLLLAWRLGLRERKRLGVLAVAGEDATAEAEAPDAAATEDTAGPEPHRTELVGLDPERATLRPKLFWFNAALTVALLTLLILQTLDIPVLFLLGAALALTVNFPNMADQKARIAAHADNVLNVSGMVFAAAVFTGVLTGTGMVDDMARSLVHALPDGLGPYMTGVTGVLSIPFTYFMSNDGFYFGIVPILAKAGAEHGISAVQIARASLIGQPLHMSSPLVPAVYVLVGMARAEFGDHTRFTVKWAALTSLVMLAAGLAFGIV